MTRSEAIKAALAEMKAEGEQLGRPDRQPDSIVWLIVRLRDQQKLSYAKIAKRLNDAGVKPAQKGKQFFPSTISKIDKGEVARRLRERYKSVL